MKQPVDLELSTVIKDGDSEETNRVTAVGEIISKQGIDMVTYDENLVEEGKVRNVVTIQANKVSVKRDGIVKMNQLFREGKKSENVYQHPHGRIHMETYTYAINYDPFSKESPGKLSIDYQVSLNGQEARMHKLTLILK